MADIAGCLRRLATLIRAGNADDDDASTAELGAAEIERVRAALRSIAALVDSDGDEPLDDAILIARRALAKQTNGLTPLPPPQFPLDGLPYEIRPVLIVRQNSVDPVQGAAGEPCHHVLVPKFFSSHVDFSHMRY